MILEAVDHRNSVVSYEVYFSIYKSKMDGVDIYIRMNSAFIRDSRQQKRISNIPRIRLDTIAFKVVNGLPLRTRRR